MPQGNPNQPWRRQSYGTWPAGDPRRTRHLRAGSLTGGPVLGLPVVLTIGVNAISATAANVVGSVNPNGSATTWWVTYGTSLPLPGTNTTPSASIGSGTLPLTFTFALTGLTTGTTYYVAFVGQSTAGTVIGNTIAFVPQTVQTPSAPVTPFGQAFVTIPHFDMPFSLVTTGTMAGAVVVEQDSLEEVLANVNTVVSCGIGQCPQLSTFGRPDLLFTQGPVDTTELVAAIQQWEPRANEQVISTLSADGTTWALTLATSSTGAQGV